MSKRSKKIKSFSIDIPRNDNDINDIGIVHYNAFIDGHLNESVGITKDWVEKQFPFLINNEGFDFRKKRIDQSINHPEDLLYLVLRDKNNKVCGFIDAQRKDRYVSPVFYIAKEMRGTGAADMLMFEVIKFANNDRMHLHVADYNQRAIKFYEKHGFNEVEDDEKIKFNKIPVKKMVRKGKNEV